MTPAVVPPAPAVVPPATAAGLALRVAGVADADLLAGWMSAAHLASTWHQDWPAARWAEELAEQLGGTRSTPVLASRDGVDVGYLELYRVAEDELGRHYRHGAADLGVHVALGPVAETGRGLGRRLLAGVATGLLAAHPACRRVVAEPDVVNLASRAAFRAAGFTEVGEVALPGKTAALTVHPRTPTDLEDLL